MSPAMTLPVILLLPLLAAVLIKIIGERNINLREGISLTIGVAVFVALLGLLPDVLAGQHPSFLIAQILPGLSLHLMLEPLGMLFALIAGFLWIITTIYAIGYMRGHKEDNQTRFYLFFAIAIAATLGVAFAGNLLTLFVFYEMLTLCTYPLVTHAGTDKARRAGRVYLGLLLGTSITFLLLAILWTWNLAGTLDFTPGGILSGVSNTATLSLLLLLFVFGVGKAALMPFHRWLPAAMVAPTPVSALLHAVAVVKAGVFTILKIAVYIFGLDLLAAIPSREFLLYVAGVSILLASLVAMRKDNLKERLAYSTISQLGYVTLGALLASQAGIMGGGLQIAAHAFGKITLFFCAGAIMVAAHKTEVSQMRGLARTMPFTMGAFLIAALSIIGLPPTGGTWSKWLLATGTLDAGQLGLLAVLMLSSLLNVAYLLPVPIRGFFDAPDNNGKTKIAEAPWPCLLAIGITTLGCVILFFFADPVTHLITLAIGAP